MNQALFAKQPIYDVNKNLYGYEILYRNSDQNEALIIDGSSATLELINNYCCSLYEAINEPYVKIFVNLTRDLIMSEIFFPIPADRIVIEILEDTVVDSEFLIRVSDLKSKGYTFALDDYLGCNKFHELLPLMDIIKVDVLSIAEDQLTEHLTHVKNLNYSDSTPVFLAEKVEDSTVLDACIDNNFQLFQGYYLSRPEIIYGAKLSTGSQVAVQLLAKLQNEDCTVDEVAALISQDIALSYKILKVINSPVCAIPKQINKVQDAVIFLGLQKIKQWAIVLSLSNQEDTPSELLRTLLERAKLCELLAQEYPCVSPETSFLVGLFSGIDLIFKIDKRWLLGKINFSKTAINAITDFQGDLGEILQIAMLIEEGKLNSLGQFSAIENTDIINFSLTATGWVSESLKTIRA